MTAVLTMLNAHEFLGAGAYLTTKEAKERGARKWWVEDSKGCSGQGREGVRQPQSHYL